MSGHRSTRRTRSGNTKGHLSWKEYLLVSLTLALLIGAAVCSRAPRPEHVTTRAITVRHGETLWGLAARNPVPGLDTAETAELIAEVNHLNGHGVTAGSTLSVPAPQDGVNVAMR